MPQKNTIKTYVEGGFYHVYNRGVEKRNIFQDEQDYKVLLKYLKTALSIPPDPKTLNIPVSFKGVSFKGVPKLTKNFNGEIDLLSYCLIPNHFHFELYQKSITSIELFMRSVFTRYSMYFNKKYKRVGKLFQSAYKARQITTDDDLLHLSRYIHLNPLGKVNKLTDAYSSYAEYLGMRNTSWVKPERILAYFQKTGDDFKQIYTYKDFVEKFAQNEKKTKKALAHLLFGEED
jgi:putative transposase